MRSDFKASLRGDCVRCGRDLTGLSHTYNYMDARTGPFCYGGGCHAVPDPESGEVRSISVTGGEKGVKPARFDLLPVGPLTVVAELYAAGAVKYDDHNWRKGYEWSKSYAALMRHITQFWDGEDHDQETGLPHVASVVFHAFSLLEGMEHHRDFDDRFKRFASDASREVSLTYTPKGAQS